MAELNVEQREAEPRGEEDYSMLEVVFWIVGILMIPLVPIAMVMLLTPFSGIGPR